MRTPPTQLFVLELLENPYHIVYPVSGEVSVAEHSCSLSARGRPADTDQPGMADLLDLGQVIHSLGQLGIYP